MNEESRSWGFATRAIHVGQPPDPTTGAVAVPIYQTATFAQEAVGQHKGYEYARTGNPTRTALEQCLASLENGAHGLAFSSGMGAESALTYLLRAGDHIVAHDDLYGGTSRLFNRLLAAFGVEVDYVDAGDPAAVAGALRPSTRMIWLETPTNPLLRIIDIAAVAEISRRAGALLVVDNTFASPYLQRPLDLGADIVLHSATKYLGGHSDVVLGAIVTRDAAVAERLRFIQNAAGAVPGPLDCWLVLRGLKTLAVRMRQHETNAREVARFLAGSGGAADGRLRRHDLGRGGGRPGGRAPRAEPHQAVHAGRKPGRRGVADRAPRQHDPRLDQPGAARRHRHRRRTNSPLGGRRGVRQTDRRSAAGAGVARTHWLSGLLHAGSETVRRSHSAGFARIDPRSGRSPIPGASARFP